LSAEYAPANKRGLYGLFTQVGGGSSLTLASLTFLAVNETMGESSPAFLQWGWRLPFLVSAALIVIALYVRLNIDETPVFAAEKVRNFVPEAPFKEVLHLLRHRELALATGSILVASAFFYMASTYFATYARTHLGYSNSLILYVSVLGGLANVGFIALGAVLSDRLGRRRMLLVGWLACLPWSFVAIPLMDTGKPILYAVAIVGMYAVAAFGWGPAAAFIPELFATRYRYTGAALTVNLAGIAGGAVPTLMAGMLLATWGSWAVGLMLAVLAVVSLVCTYLLPETLGTAFASQPTQGADVAEASPELELPGGG
jgi:MFS family permease